MLFNNNPIFSQLLVPSMTLFFFIWSLIGLAVGLGLVFYREQTFRLMSATSNWVSTRKHLKPLAIQRPTDQMVHKHRRLFGIAIIGAAALLFDLVIKFDAAPYVMLLGGGTPNFLVAWVVASAKLFLLTVSVFAVVIGVLLGFVPRIWDAVNAQMNRWYSLRNATLSVDKMHLEFDSLVMSFPRAAGWTFVVGSLIIAIDLGIVLLGRM